jgi:hypothetical protein
MYRNQEAKHDLFFYNSILNYDFQFLFSSFTPLFLQAFYNKLSHQKKRDKNTSIPPIPHEQNQWIQATTGAAKESIVPPRIAASHSQSMQKPGVP